MAAEATPSGGFISKFTVFKAALDTGHFILGALLLGLLLVVFAAMSRVGLKMVMGTPSPVPGASRRVGPVAMWVAPSLILLSLSLVLGLYLPGFLGGLIQRAAGAAGVWP